MAVAGLFSVDYNITWDIGKDRLRKFQEVSKMSYELLTNNY
jgi:hypothetical protein